MQDLKTVRFVEFYRPTAGGNLVYDIFNFTLPDGYAESFFALGQPSSQEMSLVFAILCELSVK